MKKLYSILAAISLLLIISCENEKENSNHSYTAKIISHTECKTVKSGQVANDTLSCAEYSFNAGSKKLLIKHVNAGFNCCSDFYCNVEVHSDTILIREFENGSICNCLCLYDLDIEIDGVGPQGYVIKFVEPYCDDEEPLIFRVNLAVEPEGTHCVSRNSYPWGIH